MRHGDVGPVQTPPPHVLHCGRKAVGVDPPGLVHPVEPGCLQGRGVQPGRQAVGDGITEEDEAEHHGTIVDGFRPAVKPPCAQPGQGTTAVNG